MFKTHMGPVDDDSGVTYLRPETAQGMFVDFPLVQMVSRKKLPFGIAQIGKSFRNEITPSNFIFRTREFEQMEMEYFVEPGTDDEWFDHWVNARLQWYLDLGVSKDKLRLRPHDADELAHYAKAATDIEYEFPFGWGELEGIANRTDFDLRAAPGGERSGPDVLRPGEGAALPALRGGAGGGRGPRDVDVPAGCLHRGRGADREGRHREADGAGAPSRPGSDKVAVLPLSRNETLVPEARRVFDLVKGEWMCQYDDAGAIGRRYRRQDEVGTPFCVTVDFDSLEDRQVTVRERDTMAQERLPIDDLVGYLQERL